MLFGLKTNRDQNDEKKDPEPEHPGMICSSHVFWSFWHARGSKTSEAVLGPLHVRASGSTQMLLGVPVCMCMYTYYIYIYTHTRPPQGCCPGKCVSTARGQRFMRFRMSGRLPKWLTRFLSRTWNPKHYIRNPQTQIWCDTLSLKSQVLLKPWQKPLKKKLNKTLNTP